MAKGKTWRDQYLSEVLYHFWGRDFSQKKAFGIFKSIAQNGLLLSREQYSSFPLRDRNPLKLILNARVCFTDIPEDKLAAHCTRYGKWAVGFSRGTILAWGGCPVFYIPNHLDHHSFDDHISQSLLGVQGVLRLLENSRPYLKDKGIVEALLQASGTNSGLSAEQELDNMKGRILRFISFFKVMSDKDKDCAFLYEREWRIVSGIASIDLGNPFIELSKEQKKRFVRERQEWGKPHTLDEPESGQKLSQQPLINSFKFLNGIPEGLKKDTVAQKIVSIIVPDEEAKRKVDEYIKEHKPKFGEPLPEVKVFDSLNRDS